jgi:hypothetical protein
VALSFSGRFDIEQVVVVPNGMDKVVFVSRKRGLDFDL